MNPYEKTRSLVIKCSLACALISFTGFVVLSIWQAYVRYTLNQNFTFLGGFGLETLALLSLGLLLGLLFALRPRV